MNGCSKFRTLASTLVAGFVLLGASSSALAQADKQPQKTDKVAQPAVKKGIKVGDRAPDFTLTDSTGKSVSLAELTKQGKVVVLEWFNPTCPYVVKHHVNHKTMHDTYAKFKDKNVVWLAINSGAGTTAEANEKARKEFGIAYPVLIDATSATAKAYGAKRTPTMVIIGTDGTVLYYGAIDDNPKPDTVGANYVEKALQEILAGQTVTTASTEAYGCQIKYGE